MKIADTLLDILRDCRFDSDKLYLPQQLNRKTYLEVNRILESIGGKWNRKAKAHIFKGDVESLLENLFLTGEAILPKDIQFFSTPNDIVDEMLLSANIQQDHTVLEPSAGKGNIAKRIKERCKYKSLTLIENHEPFFKILEEESYDEVFCADFLSVNRSFDRIIMNPPFTKQQDIDHVTHAFSLLREGGRLVSIMSGGILFRQNKKAVEFRDLVSRNGGTIKSLQDEVFKESGTLVKTVIVTLDK